MSDPAGPAPDPNRPYRIWELPCMFKKTGFPVLGTFGIVERHVIIMTVETWIDLCANVPQLRTTQFEVGTYEETL